MALAVFYRALAMGAMGLTAALTGVLTALVAVLLSISSIRAAQRDHCCWAWRLGWSPSGSSRIPRRARAPAHLEAALLLGAGAGVGFGAQLILFKVAAAGGVLWAHDFGHEPQESRAILLVLSR